uniref:Uncharacterized protein n=1 Tax=Ochrobactrum phage ORM_20 TaxID=2985243 RepID=A0A9N6WVD2_9VIRU|nr:hypothetical protein ORM20_00125 [Ochrobactrum phage ORM_20]
MAKIPFLTMQKLHKSIVKDSKDLEDVKDIFYEKKPGYHPHDTALRIQTGRRNLNIKVDELRSKFVLITNPDFKENEAHA